MKKYLMSLCAALVLLVAAEPAKAAILNGGFETNNFTGWTPNPASGFTFTTNNAFGHTPIEGNVFAYLQTGAGADVYTTLSQMFTANAGDVLTFNAFFQSDEFFFGLSAFNDDGYVKIIDSSNVSTILYSNNAIALIGTGNSVSPWTARTSGPLSAGTYTIEAGVRNLFDDSFDSRLGLDNVVLSNAGPASAVPEPATMTMLGIGVAGMFGFGLRRRRANTEATPA